MTDLELLRGAHWCLNKLLWSSTWDNEKQAANTMEAIQQFYVELDERLEKEKDQNPEQPQG